VSKFRTIFEAYQQDSYS